MMYKTEEDLEAQAKLCDSGWLQAVYAAGRCDQNTRTLEISLERWYALLQLFHAKADPQKLRQHEVNKLVPQITNARTCCGG